MTLFLFYAIGSLYCQDLKCIAYLIVQTHSMKPTTLPKYTQHTAVSAIILSYDA